MSIYSIASCSTFVGLTAENASTQDKQFSRICYMMRSDVIMSQQPHLCTEVSGASCQGSERPRTAERTVSWNMQYMPVRCL